MTSARNIAPESPTSKAGSPLGSNKSSPSRPPIARKSYNTLEGVENLGTTHLEWGEYKLLRKIGVGAFGVGDLEVADGDLEHTPTAGEEAPCICLAATDAPLRFQSLVPRLLQPLFKI